MTTSVRLDGLRLIARGGQADIYDLGGGRVLRVGRRPQDVERIRYEYTVYQCLSNADVAVPRAYELLEVGGLPAIIMDRLDGPSMMDQIRANPLTARKKARQLAELHVSIARMDVSEQITDVKAKARFCIGKSDAISLLDKDRILDVLSALPDGRELCHGDFHPGNIIVQNNKNYLIDWSAASRGDFHADVAHSYILLRVVPKVPHMNSVIHFIQKSIGRTVASTYLSTVGQHRALDFKILSRWMLINAAERTFFGMASEREALLKFIRKYLSVLQHNGEEGLLYQAL